MFIHIALFRWKQGVSKEDILVTLREVEALQDKIAGVVEISTGQNNSRFSEGYTHVIVVRAETQAAIDNYRKHPNHLMVAEKIEAMEDQGIGVDLKTSDDR